MSQDMQKGQRTEIEFLNGFVVREGGKVGLSCTAPPRNIATMRETARR